MEDYACFFCSISAIKFYDPLKCQIMDVYLEWLKWDWRENKRLDIVIYEDICEEDL
jgi:hypothetical protein